MDRYSDLATALVCHQAVTGLQMAHEMMKLQGDDAVPTGPFASLHPDLRDAAMDGVRRARRIGASLSPRYHHQAWVEFLTARGWRPGPRDDGARTHPNLIAWDDLPAEQRDKDQVFLSVVIAMTLEA
jgi:hypothetical protein